MGGGRTSNRQAGSAPARLARRASDLDRWFIWRVEGGGQRIESENHARPWLLCPRLGDGGIMMRQHTASGLVGAATGRPALCRTHASFI